MLIRTRGAKRQHDGVKGWVLELVMVTAVGLVFPVYDRSRMTCLPEPRFVWTAWYWRGWSGSAEIPHWLRELEVGAWREMCLVLVTAELKKRLWDLLETEILVSY